MLSLSSVGACLITLSLLTDLAAAAAPIYPYALPSIYNTSAAYTLKANGHAIPVWSNGDYELAHFAAGTGDIAIEIALSSTNNADLSKIYVSPQKKNIAPKVSGTTISFTMPHDDYLIVSGPDGGVYGGTVGGHKPLVVLADALPTDTPEKGKTGVIDVTAKEYGAKPGAGLQANTKAVQKAIDEGTRSYGDLKKNDTFKYDHAIVYVPAGVYDLGNVVLKSNVGLYLEPGAVLHYTARPEDYKTHWRQDSRNVTWWISTEFGSENVRVFGLGLLEGNWNQDSHMANDILVPIQTKGFRADGIVMLNSGSWGTTPIGCADCYFKNIKFLNRIQPRAATGGENDGIDVMHSKNVRVEHAIAIGWDDNYSTKTWGAPTKPAAFPNWPLTYNWPSEIYARVNEDIAFEDCLGWSGCYSFKIGQGVFTEQRNISFNNGVVYRANIGFGIHHYHTVAAANGSVAARSITFSNMDVELANGIYGNMNQGWMSLRVNNPVHGVAGNGSVADVTVSDVVVRRNQWDAMVFGVSAENKMRNVHFKHVKLPGMSGYATKLEELKLNVTNAEGITYEA